MDAAQVGCASRLATVPTLADVHADPTILDRLPLDVLVDLRRQVRHLDADLDAATAKQTAWGARTGTGQGGGSGDVSSASGAPACGRPDEGEPPRVPRQLKVRILKNRSGVSHKTVTLAFEPTTLRITAAAASVEAEA